MKGAELLDRATLPAAKGLLDEFTMAEKVTTEDFMEEAGYGTSAANQRLWRNLWKNLFQMCETGIDRILFYRTKEFDNYCKEYPKTNEITLLETVLSWGDVYGPQIMELGCSRNGCDHVPNIPNTCSTTDTSRYWGHTSVWNLLDYPAIVFPVTKVDARRDARDTTYTPRNEFDSWAHEHYDAQKQQDVPVCLQLVAKKLEDEKVVQALEAIKEKIGFSGLLGITSVSLS
ncbi:hypothetical protein BDV36DRAFT_298671 [Aspergillus pseudocaelatus]|uniref:Amidase domain-containing protein n=1 Tax=Aspergillus pseudocaelatus TaxID=1825620 RepID=A0ABQ6WCI2_9EURO|nr:hypothetical protein BDV36DRAFT_298671 [Aspergillus pseudocaelatus]